MSVWNPLPASLVLLPLALLMAALGWWQVERMNAKQSLIDEFENAAQVTLDDALEQQPNFAQVSATGRFDTRRHVMLDNQVLAGTAGVHVLTPFQTFSGTSILVNRGWKPLPADRSSLPDVWTPVVPLRIRGMLAPPPEHRQKLGEPDELNRDTWPQLVTYLEIPTVADALGTPLPDRVIWLDRDHPAGFEGRDWAPTVMTPGRHRAYAVQWFGLAVAALVIWAILLLRHRAAQRGSRAT